MAFFALARCSSASFIFSAFADPLSTVVLETLEILDVVGLLRIPEALVDVLVTVDDVFGFDAGLRVPPGEDAEPNKALRLASTLRL